MSVLSPFTLFTVYSYKVVLVHSAVVTLHSPANPSTAGDRGGGRPGEKGAGGVREAGEEGVGSGRKRGKLRNIAQCFAIEKMQRGGSQKIQGGNRD